MNRRRTRINIGAEDPAPPAPTWQELVTMTVELTVAVIVVVIALQVVAAWLPNL